MMDRGKGLVLANDEEEIWIEIEEDGFLFGLIAGEVTMAIDGSG